MEHRDKDELQKEVEKRDEESGRSAVQNTSANTEPGVESFPADRDAGLFIMVKWAEILMKTIRKK